MMHSIADILRCMHSADSSGCSAPDLAGLPLEVEVKVQVQDVAEQVEADAPAQGAAPSMGVILHTRVHVRMTDTPLPKAHL